MTSETSAITTTEKSVLCVTLKHLTVPTPVKEGDDVQLKCTYDLEGSDLYSVKWYKDREEFYRYIPKESPQQKVFDTDGITVDLRESSMATVSLTNVGLKSSGAYKCEVSADAPDFQTKFSVKDMDVYVLPESGPKIIGGKRRYLIGDHVNVTCTSGKSKPPAVLNWLINGVPIRFCDLIAQVTAKVGILRLLSEGQMSAETVNKDTLTVTPLAHCRAIRYERHDWPFVADHGIFLKFQPTFQENMTKNELFPAERGLMSSSRSLSFYVKERHLDSGSLILECVSVIGRYSKTYKDSVQGGYRSTWGKGEKFFDILHNY
ncbi:hypothetical protein GQR58_014983 [Nymphon striatum]|nr:hypothetical protein GQR58_014983 [Nymphon striatum]